MQPKKKLNFVKQIKYHNILFAILTASFLNWNHTKQIEARHGVMQ